jgi:hypothetical protein
MADDISKRIARFIEPFRVSPRSTVKLERDFDPAFKAGSRRRRTAPTAEGGHRLLAEYQARLAAQDTYACWSSSRRSMRGQGRHDPPRHERRQPAGGAGGELQGSLGGELDQDFYGATRNACRPAERSASSTGRTTRRCSSFECTRRISSPEAPDEARGHHVWKRRYEAINNWESTSPTTVPDREALPERFARGATRAFPEAYRPPGHNWKFSAHDVEERQFWDAYQEGVLRGVHAHKHVVGAWYVIPADRKWFAHIVAAPRSRTR